jgi:hypothetical protein
LADDPSTQHDRFAPRRVKQGGATRHIRPQDKTGGDQTRRPSTSLLRDEVPLLFLPSNRRSRGAVELRTAAARVEHARPSAGGTQVSSPRSERVLTVVVKTRRSLRPVEVRATGRCRAQAGPLGASGAVDSAVGSRACTAHQSSTGAGASRLSSRDVPGGRERLVSSVSTDGSARLQITRCRALPTVFGDGGVRRRVRRGAGTYLRPRLTGGNRSVVRNRGAALRSRRGLRQGCADYETAEDK